MSAEDPTPGEIWRKLLDLTTQIGGLVDELKRRDTYVDENYLRRQVWHEARRADQAAVANIVQDLGAIQKQQATDRAWRRKVMLAVALALVSSLLAIAGLVLTVVSSTQG